MDSNIRKEIIEAVREFELRHPIVKYQFQLGGHDAGAFHAHVAKNAFQHDQIAEPRMGGYPCHIATNLSNAQLAREVGEAYKVLQYNDYTSSEPGDTVFELVADKQNHHPASNVFIGTLVSELPSLDEPARSACIIDGRDGSITFHPKSQIVEYARERGVELGGELDMYCVLDKHQHIHPISMAIENGLPTFKVQDVEHFAFKQQCSSADLADDFTRVCEKLLKHHYQIDLNDTNLADGAIVSSYVSGQIQPYEAVNEIAQKFDLQRFVNGISSDLPLSEADEKRIRMVHYFDSTAEAYDAVQVGEVERGHTLVIESERVVGLAWTWPIAVTPEVGGLHHINEEEVYPSDIMAEARITPEQIKLAAEQARERGFGVREWAVELGGGEQIKPAKTLGMG